METLSNQMNTPYNSIIPHRSSSIATFNHNCKIVASGGDDGVIKLFNNSLQLVHSLNDNDISNSLITSIAFSHDSKFLAYSASNGFFKIYNITQSEYTLTGRVPNDYITSIQFNNDNTKITLSTSKGDLNSYSSPTFQISNMKMQLNTNITYMRYSPFYLDTIGLCTGDGSIKIINLANGEIMNNFTGYHSSAATGIAFSPVTEVFFCSCGLDGRLNFFDIKGNKFIKTLMTNAALTSVAFNLEGNHIICGDENGGVLVYDLRNADKPTFSLKGNNGRVSYIEVRKKMVKQQQQLQGQGQGQVSRSLNNSMQSIEMDQSKSKPLTNSGNAINKNQQHTYEIENKERTSMNINMNTSQANTILNQPISDLFSKSTKDLNKKNLLMMSNKEKGNELQPMQQQQEMKYNNNNELQNIPMTNYNVTQSNNNQLALYNVDPQTQEFVRKCIENETEKLKEFVHEHINSLHLELIRQFEINQAEMIENIKPIIVMNNKLNQEIEKLKRENEDLKSKYF